jgi:hypothetical protein
MSSSTAGGLVAALLLATATFSAGCAEETVTGEPRVRVVKNADVAVEKGGIPPDKQADIQLLLQQRAPSTTKCYDDVLNDKHDRAFKGTVIVLLTLKPAGASSTATAKVIGGTLNNDEVSSCLTEKLATFEYPDLQDTGTMQYTYTFQPAY